MSFLTSKQGNTLRVQLSYQEILVMRWRCVQTKSSSDGIPASNLLHHEDLLWVGCERLKIQPQCHPKLQKLDGDSFT